MPISGIYMIRCTENGGIYIGSSIDIIHRLRKHKNNLYADKHINPIIQNAWNKYGDDSFKFLVIIKCPPLKNRELEQTVLDLFRIMCPDQIMNIALKTTNPNLGRKLNNEEIEKLKNRMIGNKLALGNKLSSETKGKIANAQKIRIRSKEEIRKSSESRKGIKLTEEHRIKISESKKGKYPTKETCKKMSKAQMGNKSNLGRNLSEEHKQKISMANIGKH